MNALSFASLPAAPPGVLRRRHSAPPLPTAVERDTYAESPSRRAIGALHNAPTSLGQKAHIFGTLVRTSGEYRNVMLPAWTHSLGNGTLGGCFVGLLAGIGGFSAAESFFAYGMVEMGQMLMFGIFNVFGGHERDAASPVRGESSLDQRAAYKRKLGAICLVDVAIGATLIGVALCMQAGSLPVLATLLAVRLAMSCKNSYETNIFTCIRQLGRVEDEAEQAQKAGQALVSMESFISMMGYQLAGLATQFTFITAASTPFVPLAVGAVIVGTCITVLPKVYVYWRD